HDPVHLLELEEQERIEAGERPIWKVARFPAFDEDDKPADDKFKPEDAPRIKEEYREQARPLFWLESRDPDEVVFKPEIVDGSFHPRVSPIYKLSREQAVAAGVNVFAAVDPGLERKKSADRCGISVGAIELQSQKRRYLWPETGRWAPEELAMRILEIELRYS